MPTCMRNRVRCDTCGNFRQRKDMSFFNGICAHCLDAYYLLCAGCGCLLRRPGVANSPTINYENPLYRRDNPGASLCYMCLHAGDRYATWKPTPLDLSFATYQRVGSKRKFGVEIETYSCDGYTDLEGKTKFGCKSDCTISGKEFVSPVLYGDEGLNEIEEFLTNAHYLNWSVDSDCGCHTHFDMRNESDQELFRVAYAYNLTYNFWKRCVGTGRVNCSYCRQPSYTRQDLRRNSEDCRAFSTYARRTERYNFVNLQAYTSHNTFENRLLEGTLDPERICNWITVHCRFIDYVKHLDFNDLDELFLSNCRTRSYNQCVEQTIPVLAKIVDDLIDWLYESTSPTPSQSARRTPF